MKPRAIVFTSILALLTGGPLAVAQETASTISPITSASTSTSVPRLVRFSGMAKDLNGKPLTGTLGVTFLLYSAEQGGSPLWLETQNVQPDSSGRYSVQLGATKPDGLPTDLFTSGEARWLGVQISGQAEQPRVLLLSVPYALKAGDAETVGGLPPSAFVLANGAQAGAPGAKGATNSASATKNAPPPANPAVTGKGVVDFIPMWDTTSDIVDSIMFQKSSQIGINTTAPAATLDVSGKTDIRDTLTLFPKSTDNTLAVNGTSFKVDSTGKVTFISGQTFPGAGTITGITTATGSGLSGGGTSGTLTLKVPSAGITNTMLQNSKITLNSSTAGGLTVPGAMSLGSTYTIGLKTCSSKQVLQYSGTSWGCANAGTGSVTSVASGSGLTGGPITTTGTLSIATAGVTNTMLKNSSLTVTAGTGLTGGGSVALGAATTLNINTAVVPQLNTPNSFTQALSVNTTNPFGSIQATGTGEAIVGTMTTNDFFTPAILGNATASGSGTTIGVEGAASTDSGYGVYGSAGSTGTGVNGTSANGTGVNGTSTNGSGVNGTSTNGTGVNASSTNADAVIGIGAFDGAYFRGPAAGTFSENDTDSNFSVAAYGEEFGSTTETFGLYGYSASSVGVGTYGQAITSSAEGALIAGFIPFGVWGDSGATGAIGVLGSADDGSALYALNNSPSDFPTVVFENDETAFNNNLILEVIGAGFGGGCNIDVSGNLACSGTITPVVPVAGGSQKVALGAISSPEHWFEDAGSGQLLNGEAVINIEPVFGETVNTGVDYHVFLTPNGDCKGLYVAQKSPTSFVVRELGGGTASIAFDYRIMAKRRGFEQLRLVDKTREMNAPRPKRALGPRPAMPKPQDIRKAQEDHLHTANLAKPVLKTK
jgi:hypothetical protein